jgi:site-specific recombinase XerD
LTHVIQRAFKRAGLDGCTAHTLRHTHATRLIQNGLNLYEIKEILGHADIQTTMRYAHIEQEQVSRKAVNVINNFNTKQLTPTDQ